MPKSSEQGTVNPEVTKDASTEAEQPTKPSSTTQPLALKDTPEFKEELQNAQIGWDRKLGLLNYEKTQLEARIKATEDREATLQAEHDEAMNQFFSDDPDKKQAYFDRRQIAKEKRALIAEKADIEKARYEHAQSDFDARMAQRRKELVAETGTPESELMECETEDEMEVKALRHQLQHPRTQPPKLDSGISSGLAGVDLDKLTPEEKMRVGLKRLKII